MEHEVQHTVSYHVSLVVLPVDDFTGKPITGGQVRIYAAGEKASVIKPDGYHIFMNLQERKITIHCVGEWYTSRTEEIILSSDSVPQIVKLRLSPSASYPIPSGAACVAGKAAPGKKIRFFCTNSEEMYRLSGEYSCTGDARDTLHIFNPSQKDLEGRTMLIQDKNGQQEYFSIVAMVEEDYRMALPLQRDYKRIGTVLYPVFETYSDSKGDFFILLENRRKKEDVWSWEIEGDPTKREVVLTSGRTSRIE